MSYDMINWMMMDPSIRDTTHLEGVKLDGTPTNSLFSHVVLQPNGIGKAHWCKSYKNGWPWDIRLYDANIIYFSVTENGWTSSSMCKKFLSPTFGWQGVPFALRNMNIGDIVRSNDSTYRVYSDCTTYVAKNLLDVQCELHGPFSTDFGGDIGIRTNIAIYYRWGGNFTTGIFNTMERYYMCQPYGLVRWDTQNWNAVTGQYDPPNTGSIFNLVRPTIHAIVNPCSF